MHFFGIIYLKGRSGLSACALEDQNMLRRGPGPNCSPRSSSAPSPQAGLVDLVAQHGGSAISVLPSVLGSAIPPTLTAILLLGLSLSLASSVLSPGIVCDTHPLNTSAVLASSFSPQVLLPTLYGGAASHASSSYMYLMRGTHIRNALLALSCSTPVCYGGEASEVIRYMDTEAVLYRTSGNICYHNNHVHNKHRHTRSQLS